MMRTQAQFDYFDVPQRKTGRTYGVKYAGSKAKLIPHIMREIGELSGHRVLDGFAGTTRVTQALAEAGHSVVCNDRSPLSKVMADCFLFGHGRDKLYQQQIQHLNDLMPCDGWYTEHYGADGSSLQSAGRDGLKKPWQYQNTRKLDAIRPEIDKISLDGINKSVLLTSLIFALDTVDNTIGHYAAYLDKWSLRSNKTMKLVVPNVLDSMGERNHETHQSDIFDILNNNTFDICYFDPPYGSNNEKMPPSRVRYDAYYHLWKTVIFNDKPKLFGKVNRREDTRDNYDASLFESFKKDDGGRFVAVSAIDRLLREANTKYIILSYSSGGRATFECLMDVISSSGRVIKVAELDYKKNVMANMTWTGEWLREFEEPNREYVFVIEK